jgi:hypothetical protein
MPLSAIFGHRWDLQSTPGHAKVNDLSNVYSGNHAITNHVRFVYISAWLLPGIRCSDVSSLVSRLTVYKAMTYLMHYGYKILPVMAVYPMVSSQYQFRADRILALLSYHWQTLVCFAYKRLCPIQPDESENNLTWTVTPKHHQVIVRDITPLIVFRAHQFWYLTQLGLFPHADCQFL